MPLYPAAPTGGGGDTGGMTQDTPVDYVTITDSQTGDPTKVQVTSGLIRTIPAETPAAVNQDPVSAPTLPATLAKGQTYTTDGSAYNLVNLDVAASYFYSSVTDAQYPLGAFVVNSNTQCTFTVPINLPSGTASLVLRGLAGGSSGAQFTVT